MLIKHGLFEEKEGTVIVWHEDSTQVGNYILTVQTETGSIISALKKRLTPKQINELKDTVPKDETGI
ncbi:hypothetical protein [Alkalibacterium sp. 20]|uniref:hypothetical protein n=1 Tax=Alkalibacterium sp. 20 TaxID=1798803 RepID=UPI00090017D8|nr:hypothetical protein [Alkalibacterium sp. 20]OJF96170.1 hypothetical protein AX762_05405 [Alkalibacterium sp. 20]